MKDLNCHALYGVDDGCDSLDESIALLRKMSKAGIKEVVLTPHYIEDSNYACRNKDKKIFFDKLNKKISDEDIDIKIYLGNEVMFTDNILKLIDNNSVYPINDSKYVLYEFPMHNSYKDSGEVISELLSRGYTPILAHPERYAYFQKHPDVAEEYLRMGVLLQCNIGSLYGKYGRSAKKIIKYYIKKGWVSFLGSDAHHDFKYKVKKIAHKINKINKDSQYINNLLEGNFDRVINNEDLGMIR